MVIQALSDFPSASSLCIGFGECITLSPSRLCPPPSRKKRYLQPPPAPKKEPESGLADGLRRLFQGTPKPEKNAKTITSAPPALDSNATAADPPKPKGRPPQPRRLRVDLVLYSGGRDANSETLGCADAGVDLARYGRVKASHAPTRNKNRCWRRLPMLFHSHFRSSSE